MPSPPLKVRVTPLPLPPSASTFVCRTSPPFWKKATMALRAAITSVRRAVFIGQGRRRLGRGAVWRVSGGILQGGPVTDRKTARGWDGTMTVWPSSYKRGEMATGGGCPRWALFAAAEECMGGSDTSTVSGSSGTFDSEAICEHQHMLCRGPPPKMLPPMFAIGGRRLVSPNSRVL